MRGRLMLIATALLTTGCGQVVEERRTKLLDHQLRTARAEYEGARTNLDRCIAAKLVAVAQADLGNTVDAQAWRAREGADCEAAFADLGPVTDLDAPEGGRPEPR